MIAKFKRKNGLTFILNIYFKEYYKKIEIFFSWIVSWLKVLFFSFKIYLKFELKVTFSARYHDQHERLKKNVAHKNAVQKMHLNIAIFVMAKMRWTQMYYKNFSQNWLEKVGKESY